MERKGGKEDERGGGRKECRVVGVWEWVGGEGWCGVRGESVGLGDDGGKEVWWVRYGASQLVLSSLIDILSSCLAHPHSFPPLSPPPNTPTRV